MWKLKKATPRLRDSLIKSKVNTQTRVNVNNNFFCDNTFKINIHSPEIQELLALGFFKVILTPLCYSLVYKTSFYLQVSC